MTIKHYGDIKNLSGYELPIVDVITGGSPCQDLSVAGKRAGLDGERSGLFMEQIRIVKEMRERDRNENGRTGFLVRPRYMVWENVTGALSSGYPKGADFQAVLTEIARISDPDCPDVPLPKKWGGSGCLYDDMGRWSIAWRVHDAQFWGVPQRRKRIALVADFGGLSAPEILFERKGMHWHSPESTEARKTDSRTTERCTGKTGGAGDTNARESGAFTLKVRGGCEYDSHGKRAGKGALIQKERSGTLGVSQDQTLIQIDNVYTLDEKMGQTYIHEDQGNTLAARDYKQPQAVCYGISAYNSNAMKSSNPNSGIYIADTTRTLDLNGGSPACNQGGIAVVENPECVIEEKK